METLKHISIRTKKRQSTFDSTMTLEFFAMKKQAMASELELREREANSREKEGQARVQEVEIMKQKSKIELQIMNIEKKALLLKTRQELKDKGVPVEEINQLLPLNPQ